MNSKHESRFFATALRAVLLMLLTTTALLWPLPSSSGNNPPQAQGVDLYYFWSRYCPHCREAKPFIENLTHKYPWLNLHSYDLVGNRSNQEFFLDMAERLGQTAKSVPAFIYCGQMMVGYDRAETTGQQLEKNLLECYRHHGQPLLQTPAEFQLPGLGRIGYRDFSLPVFTLIVAALDAFNPCAFFVLFFLLSLLVQHHSRIRMLTVGTTFVVCSGVMYFMFMAAWLNLFLLTEQLRIVTAIAGVIAIVFGLLNIKDYFFFRRGVSLSLSDSARSKLFARIRGLTQSGSWPAMIFATLVLAAAANSYELLCTAGLPMVFTRVLTLHELDVAQYYLYLVFYNIIYIIPLLLIVVAFAATLGSKKLSVLEGRLLKMLSGSMMLGLGFVLLSKPEWLNNMLVSLAIISGAILLTAALALLNKTKPDSM